jgi:hypothetical protein
MNPSPNPPPRIRDILTNGNPIAKALFEALIEKMEINSDGSLTPIFKLPMKRQAKGWRPGIVAAPVRVRQRPRRAAGCRG